ncbi:branched-chain amino acid ABC transporter permease [Thermodesulfobacteriota bacterium]
MAAQIFAYGIIIGAFYGLVAIGLALLFGIMRYMNIAHGTFMVIGGYISFWLFTFWHVDPFVSIPIVILAMFLIGFIVYRVVFSPLRKYPEEQRMNSSMLITFGLILVMDNTAMLLWTSDVRTITTPYSGGTFQLLGVRLPLTGVAMLGVTIIVIFALHLFLNRTYLGKSIRATAENWEAANLLGINIDRTYLISCGISIALAGVAGTGTAVMYSISPGSGLEWLLIAMVVLVLAGMGNIKSVFFAGLLLGLLEQVSVYFVGGHYRSVVGLVLFVLILILRPKGLFVR